MISVIQKNLNLTLYEIGNFHSQGPENWEIGQKAGCFYKIKNKEHGREKRKWTRNKEAQNRALNWPGIWGLADWINMVFLLKQHVFRDIKLSTFADTAPQAGATPSWAKRFISADLNGGECITNRSNRS